MKAYLKKTQQVEVHTVEQAQQIAKYDQKKFNLELFLTILIEQDHTGKSKTWLGRWGVCVRLQ